MEKQRRWLRLDNAAKIYPAARSRSWSNLFRVSCTLNEDVDREVLQRALEVTVKRFPSVAVRIRRGLFWYYLEEVTKAPEIKDEYAYPLDRMPFDDIRKCAFRTIVHKNRIAVEFFHAVTDGNGGVVFLKTLVAEYLRQKYNVTIPSEYGILDVEEETTDAELEDSYLKNYGIVSYDRGEPDAYRLDGTVEKDGFLNVISGELDVKEVLARARSYGVSLTTFLTSVMIDCVIKLQNKRVPNRRRQKPVKILLPVNLRTIFGSSSLRNFVLYITPGIDPRLGDYTFDEIVKSVHHQMGYELDRHQMAARITANVKLEQLFIVKILPLFIKNPIMKLVFNLVGEKKSCLTLSNLGLTKVPLEMEGFVRRFDFVLGPQSKCKNNCGVISFGDKLYINFLRTIEESELERDFFCALVKMGLKVKLESNSRAEFDKTN